MKSRKPTMGRIRTYFFHVLGHSLETPGSTRKLAYLFLTYRLNDRMLIILHGKAHCKSSIVILIQSNLCISLIRYTFFALAIIGYLSSYFQRWEHNVNQI